MTLTTKRRNFYFYFIFQVSHIRNLTCPTGLLYVITFHLRDLVNKTTTIHAKIGKGIKKGIKSSTRPGWAGAFTEYSVVYLSFKRLHRSQPSQIHDIDSLPLGLDFKIQTGVDRKIIIYSKNTLNTYFFLSQK